jgi:hypothetical protein
MLHLINSPAPAVLAGDVLGGLPKRKRRPAAPLNVPAQANRQALPDADQGHVDQQFMDMLKAYRPSGGLLRAPDMAARCKPNGGTDVRTLADWIIHRKVVSFEWLSRIWLPVFQFHRYDMTRQSGLDEVMLELVGVYDDWQIASWFSSPNHALGLATPADTLANAAQDVVHAARAERFLLAI